MTFVGHCMTGMAIGLVLVPAQTPRRRLIFALALCAIFANVPDFKFRHWGHEDYAFSHSIFVNSAIILSLGLVMALVGKPFLKKIPWRMFFAVGGAWLSHLLLDTFYNHGMGLRMFWPFSQAAVVLPLPWFHNIDVKAGFFAWHNLSEYLSEFLFFPLVFAAAWLVRLYRSSADIENKSSTT